MLDVIKVATYICSRYKMQFKMDITEMKLHKLLYFVQRESIIQTGEPMFAESFLAWRYGPIVLCVRNYFNAGMLKESISAEDEAKYKNVFDTVFLQLAGKDAWSLSRLSHGESSWINARKGLNPDENGNVPLALEDIRNDADRIKLHRILVETKAIHAAK